jgi:hypothetical protein
LTAGAGSFGGFVSLKNKDGCFGISCGHVWNMDDDVYQPSVSDLEHDLDQAREQKQKAPDALKQRWNSLLEEHEKSKRSQCCGKVVFSGIRRLNSQQTLDVALCKLDDDVSVSNSVGKAFQCGEIGQHLNDLMKMRTSVWKQGRTTGLTNGVLHNRLHDVKLKGQNVITKEYVVISDKYYNTFCAQGDSGSIVCTDSHLAVGLLWGGGVKTNGTELGFDDTDFIGHSIAYVTPMSDVFAFLKENGFDVEMFIQQ